MIRPYTTTTIVVVGYCLLAPLFVSCTTFALSTNKHINLRGSEYGSRRIFQIQLSLDLLSISGLTGSVIAWYILSNFFLRRVGFDPCAFPRSKNILNLGRSNQCPSGSGYTESSTPSVSVDLPVSLLGRILASSSSLPIVGVYQHFPSLSEKFCLQEVMIYQHHHYLM